MRFALVGNDREGVALARAMIDSGRHRLQYVTSVPRDRPWPEDVRQVNDLEEVLADPEVEAVIVASSLANRAAHLRRALQSERTVFCLHPVDTRPDAAYEAGMIRQDTRQLLLPIMPGAF